jgi:hypothetical protein
MTPNSTTSLIFIALVPLIAWRLYSRIRRLIGRQQSKLWRHWTAAILFPLLMTLLVFPLLMTLLVFGMLASYYAAYAVGMLRWRRSNPPASAPTP